MTDKPRIVNTKGYAYDQDGMARDRKRRTLTVTFITDMVPGSFHDPEDLMREIARNPYVDTVTLED